jgi:hypothetical protein
MNPTSPDDALHRTRHGATVAGVASGARVAELRLQASIKRMPSIIGFCLFIATTFAAMSGEPAPQFPRVHGDYQMTPNWRVTLPDEFAKRFENGEFGTDLVLWRPGITCWITAYNQKEGETPAATLEWRKSNKPKEAIQEFEFRDSKPLRYGFLLHEKPKDDKERWGLHTLTFGESGHVLMVIYFDRRQDLEIAKKIWLSINDTPE